MIKDKVFRGQGFLKTNEELANRLEQFPACYADAFFACSTYEFVKEGRKQSNVHKAKAFWLDVDAGEGKPYADYKEAENAIITFSTQCGLPNPLLVCSGGGIHAYYVLSEAIDAFVWKEIARQFKACCEAKGLHADPSRTADIASILRPIGTMNFKKGEGRKVYSLNKVTPIKLEDFTKAIGARIPVQTVLDPVSSAILGGLSQKNYEPSYGAIVAKNCKQLRAFERSGGNVPEPIWYACLGVLAHCADGDDLGHAWSSKYPGYTYAETQRKIEQARNAAGPTTCEHFKFCNPSGCVGCPHNKTSPILLGRTEAVITPPYIGGSDADKKAIPPLPEGFKYGPNNQILGRVKDPETDEFKDIVVSQYPFYVAAVREQETKGVAGGQSLKIATRTPHSPWKDFTAMRADLMGQGWLSVLGNYGVVCEPGTEKLFRRLIHSMVMSKTHEEKMEISYKSFGWKNSREGFVAGNKLYTKNSVSEVSGTKEFEKAAALLSPKPKGSLNRWRAAANRVFAPGCEAQAFSMLCSFAAPLMDLLYADDEGGTIVSLVSSKTGQGKTAAILAAETVWGQTNCLRITERASTAAKFRAIGVRCNMPIVIDEWGNSDKEVLRDFVANFTGGLDKARLAMSGEDVKEQLDWKTVMIGTTNLPLVGTLRQSHYNAQAARIFEVNVNIPSYLASSQTADLNQEFEANAGLAGPVFLMHLLKNYDLNALKNKANAIADWIGKKLKASTEERFKTRLVAAVAVVSMVLTDKANNNESLLEFSPRRMIDWAIDAIAESMRDHTMLRDPLDCLMEFIQENMQSFVIVPGAYRHKPYANPVLPRQMPLIGRYEKENGRLYIPHTIMHKFTLSIKVPYLEFAKDLTTLGIVINRNRQTMLTAGVEALTPVKMSCWEIDLFHPKAGEIVDTLEGEKNDSPIK